MAITKHLVFVSSTSDLREERQAVASSLLRGWEAYLYEEDSSRGASPEEHLLEKLSVEADLFLGILGPSWGSAYGDSDTSIVEWEFGQAEARKDLETKAYLKDSDPKVIDKRQRAFRERVTDFRAGQWVGFFKTLDELREQVRDDLGAYLTERKLMTDRKLKSDRRRFGLVAILVALAGIAVAVFLHEAVDWLILGVVELLLAVVVVLCLLGIRQ